MERAQTGKALTVEEKEGNKGGSTAEVEKEHWFPKFS